ncbi:probable xyloglucan galactosyltransferase GT14 [Vigna radiata var. radiata]|uniref:Probable xyloglucan galactosyltransferase GT14 n=1 Tax=Vigna radiata var. radiata TaxID=3916 RepID=A0A1S3VU43_VIGRR|nr:probable xyloglucan galactosyltransferase GT14 [Vigna radiata var. radiata]
MEKSALIFRGCYDNHHFCLAILFSFLFCTLFLSFRAPNKALTFKHLNPATTTDPCFGRYVYIHQLPSRFNDDLLHNCHTLTRGTDKPNMCPYMQNMGLGPQILTSQGVLTNNTWYATNQFLLEVIFHNRMTKYACLTNDSSVASAIFVPFYAGLDVSRFLWLSNLTHRDSSGRDLLQWLANRPEWKKMWGRDHFLISGRIAWDFRRQRDEESYWGSKFRFLPESMNMSMLAVEASSWNNDYAIPYPTSFHPSDDTQVLQWQKKIRHQKRPYLFTFTGAPRPELEGSIRGKIIDQCRASSVCKFVDCSYGVERCDDPVNVIKVFRSSVFCLQPQGDSYTRRSIFDSMLAGCIPVFFHPGTAYSQYKWHLPRNRTGYSVYIPVKDVKQWNTSVEEVLLGISESEVLAMREEVIKVIPNIIYADPRSKLDFFEDAFDLAVKGMLERIEKVREATRRGRDPSIGFADEDHYKYTFSQSYS